MSRYLLRDRLSERSYFLANRRCFLFRHADSGFKSKWSGLWGRELKYIEYFAFRAGDEWLSEKNVESTEYDFCKCVHTYRTPDGKSRETLFIPEGGDCLMLMLELPKPAEVELKLAVNIRRIGENETARRYRTCPKEGHIEVSNGLGKIFISGPGDTAFERGGRMEAHEPSGERENYYLPGKITCSGKKVVFCIGPQMANAKGFDSLLTEKESAYSAITKGLVECSDKGLEKAFNSAVLCTELLRKDWGFCAGLPWFQQAWGRDALWSLPAVISSGQHEAAKETLLMFSSASEDRVPNFVSKDMGKSITSIDATLLWLISLESYHRSTNDTQLLGKLHGRINQYLSFLYSRTNYGFLDHDKEASETWMDTLRRCCNAVEIQALYYRALLSASYLLGEIGDKTASEEASSLSETIKERFDRDFFAEGFYADRIGPDGAVHRKTANAIVPAFTGPGAMWKDILDEAESGEFSCGKGARTLAKSEEDYEPGGYHTGSAWSLTTGWMAAAEFLRGRPEKGWKTLKKMIGDMDCDGIGCIGECWNAETSELTGCQLQLWGVAFLIRVVDEFMLGIEADAPHGEIRVRPSMPKAVGRISRRIMLGNRRVGLTFERRNGEINVTSSDRSVKLIKK